MAISRASYKAPKNQTAAQDHNTWKEAVQNEDHGHKWSLYEGIKIGVVNKIRLDELVEPRSRDKQPMLMGHRQNSQSVISGAFREHGDLSDLNNGHTLSNENIKKFAKKIPLPKLRSLVSQVAI